MARDVADDTYYVTSGGKIPVKWTAPEVYSYVHIFRIIIHNYVSKNYRQYFIKNIPLKVIYGVLAV